MTQEHKDLLLKDLCTRLPYGVKASTKLGNNIIVSFIGEDTIIGEDGDSYDISFITPYLFPMSSMTEEQFEEFLDICGWCGYIDEVRQGDFFNRDENIGFTHIYGTMDWLNRNHFDYRGLIEKGLALKAPDGMYN